MGLFDFRPDRREASEAAGADRRRAWAISGMGFEMASEVAAGALIGFGLDHLFGTRPGCTIAGAILGILVGMSRFIREALRLTPGPPPSGARPLEDASDDDASPPPPDDATRPEPHR